MILAMAHVRVRDPLWGFEHWRNARPQIPQVRGIDALFDSAPRSQRQAVRSALLVCRIDAVENADTRDVVFLRHGKPVGPTNPDLPFGLMCSAARASEWYDGPCVGGSRCW